MEHTVMNPNQITEDQKCCGVDVRRDYYVDDCRRTLTCPDCGTTYTRESIYETPRTPEGELILRPCPFCGEPAAWGEGEQKTKYGNEQVYCSNCYAMTAPEGTKEEAAFLWNDRNDPNASLEAERDALLAEVAQLRSEALKGICVYCGYIEQYESLEHKASEEGNAMRVAHIRQCEARPELKLIAFSEQLIDELDQVRKALRTSAYQRHKVDGDHAPNFVSFDECKREDCVHARAALRGKGEGE